MADWRKLARRLALADGVIDQVEAEIIRKELLADRVIDKEELAFLFEIMRDAEDVVPSFRKLFRKSAKRPSWRTARFPRKKLSGSEPYLIRKTRPRATISFCANSIKKQKR